MENKKSMKTIKNIMITCLLVCVSIIGFSACEEKCKIKYPKDVKPIDWENYNDVYTTYWNTVHSCSESITLQSDTIKIYGWLTEYSLHSGCLNLKNTKQDNKGETTVSVTVRITDEIEKNIYEKLYAPNFPKKCFAKGELIFDIIETNDCMAVPRINVFNVDDIYFE